MIGMNGICAYAAAKWGLRGLAKSNAIELGRAGIRVNTVCPAGGNGEMFLPWADTLGRHDAAIPISTSPIAASPATRPSRRSPTPSPTSSPTRART
jgi:NAD(P)-dependent dehydrogenase (short-subunit alcohol dehydrogenase family)